MRTHGSLGTHTSVCVPNPCNAAKQQPLRMAWYAVHSEVINTSSGSCSSHYSSTPSHKSVLIWAGDRCFSCSPCRTNLRARVLYQMRRSRLVGLASNSHTVKVMSLLARPFASRVGKSELRRLVAFWLGPVQRRSRQEDASTLRILLAKFQVGTYVGARPQAEL